MWTIEFRHEVYAFDKRSQVLKFVNFAFQSSSNVPKTQKRLWRKWTVRNFVAIAFVSRCRATVTHRACETSNACATCVRDTGRNSQSRLLTRQSPGGVFFWESLSRGVWEGSDRVGRIEKRQITDLMSGHLSLTPSLLFNPFLSKDTELFTKDQIETIGVQNTVTP